MSQMPWYCIVRGLQWLGSSVSIANGLHLKTVSNPKPSTSRRGDSVVSLSADPCHTLWGAALLLLPPGSTCRLINRLHEIDVQVLHPTRGRDSNHPAAHATCSVVQALRHNTSNPRTFRCASWGLKASFSSRPEPYSWAPIVASSSHFRTHLNPSI